jgi:hypothetical protein
VSEHIPHGMIQIDCQCCQLTQRLRDRDGPVPVICDTCYQHSGQLPEKQLARAETHEAMLRKRLTACRASEARARDDLAAAREQVRAALASRGALAERLVEAAESERRHNCAAQQLGRERYVAELARRHRELEGGWEPGEP